MIVYEHSLKEVTRSQNGSIDRKKLRISMVTCTVQYCIKQTYTGGESG
jgi:hypothetical protein